jgi:hypothetical protein
VSHDDLVPLAYARELPHRIDDMVLLNFGAGLLASLQQCVAA